MWDTRGTFVIGLDFGTESARAVLLRAGARAVAATAVQRYRHGVWQRELRGTPLPGGWALQDADDYLLAAEDILARVVAQLPPGGRVAGLGVAFTSSSPLPTLADGTPLSRSFPDEPHAYVKLWKHHAAQHHADRFNASGAPYLAFSGGRSSSEWLPAKAAQFAEEHPELWARAARFLEAGDWLVWQLTDQESCSAVHAGYKAHHREGGYPPEVRGLLGERVRDPQPGGSAAGTLTAAWQRRVGLNHAPVVAVSTIDAHAGALGVGALRAGEGVAVLGTSACYLTSSEREIPIPGISGVVAGGIVPGLYGYEAGQAAFGDVLSWLVRAVPHGPDEASAFEAYHREAAGLSPGEHGLLALDWWNGCRTPLDRGDLSGLVLGFTPATRPADVYRALMESLCFGARRVLATFGGYGLPLQRLILAGGLSERGHPLLQILADVLGREVEVSLAQYASARGAAVHAAVAAGLANDFAEGAGLFADARTRLLRPDPEATAVYEELYGAYLDLSALMAASPVMPRLQQLAERRALRPGQTPTRART